MNAIAWWAVFTSIPGTIAATGQATAPNRDYVVLLHGLGRTRLSMKALEWSLNRQGYRVVNLGYPSGKLSIEELADRHLHDELTRTITDSSVQVHFVTHSLGGIILRLYLSNHSVAHLGRVVMLGPPNQGTELADRLKRHWLGRLVLGRNGQRLGTDASDLPRRLGPVRCEVGIIAGDRSSDPWFSGMIPEPNDGKVSVKNTQVEGMKDFLVLHTTHTWMLWRRQTLRQVHHFLKHGRFDRPLGGGAGFPTSPDKDPFAGV